MTEKPDWVDDLNTPKQKRKARVLRRKIERSEDAMKPIKTELEALRKMAATYRARRKARTITQAKSSKGE
jgi:uncharacterized membrane protein YgaE (UPF0421/DUF939 family)